MWLSVLLGCGPSPEVLDQLAAMDARATAMEERLTKLEEGGSDRDARRAELQARLEARRARKASGTDAPTKTPRQLLADPDLGNFGRLMLHRGEDGEYDGYRISGVRNDSVLDLLGFRNGDVVHRVDGMELNGMQSAMKAYETIDPTKTSVTVEVLRNGSPKTLTIAMDEPVGSSSGAHEDE